MKVLRSSNRNLYFDSKRFVMKIPKKGLVKRIIKNVLKDKGIIETQEELGRIVNNELNKVNDEFTITPARVRRLALNIDKVGVMVKTRKSEDVDKPEECPACGHDLKALHAENLEGEKVDVGFKCTNCNYSGDSETYVPMKYEFRIVK